jgi:molecular chaperone GrpE
VTQEHPAPHGAQEAAGVEGTEQVPQPAAPGAPGTGQPAAPADVEALKPDLLTATEGDEPAASAEPGGPAQGEHPDTALAAERLSDLQRLQAEYVNYKRRVDRDRAVVQERAVQSVIEAMLPVLDDIHAAREHGDLEGGPFAAIADKLESTLGKFGLERYGLAGEEFDPALHEALMHTAWPADGTLPTGTGATTVVQVLQPGYRAGEQILRAARVAVADPE